MATGNPIILGGGIGKGTPFTLGSLLRITNVTPPTAGDSIVFQRTAGATEVITVSTDVSPTATERLKVGGGFISDTGVGHGTFIAGEGASSQLVANTRSVVIGYTQNNNNIGGGGSATNATNNVVIGGNTVAGLGMTQGVGGCVFLGADITFNNTLPTGSVVAIGSSITLNNAATGPIVGTAALGRGQGVAFGNFAGAQGAFSNWVCVGHSANINAANAMALGDGSQSSFTSSIALGRNAITDKANQLAIGGANVGINEMLVGEGLLAGGARADFIFRMTSSQGTDTPGGDWTYIASLGTGNAITKGSHIFQTGTPGASGVTGQAAATRLQILPAQNAAGAAVNFVATNSPGAAVGTLNNAPTAGNPEWIPILFNGVVRYLPCWP